MPAEALPPRVAAVQADGNSAGGQYVISNPSTYLYFTGDYRWRYGFGGAPGYVAGDARENLRRYLARDVTIVLGREDSDGASLLLETGPEARHRLIELEGVGHAAADVMAAEPVRDLLFG